MESSQDPQPIQQEGGEQQAVPSGRSRHSKRVGKVLSVFVLLALLAAGTGYVLPQRQELAKARQDASLAQSKIADLEKQLGEAGEVVDGEESANQAPHFGQFMAEYGKFISAENRIDAEVATVAAYTAEIEAALKDYYDLPSLPDEMAILSIYQVAKPDTLPSGELKALVYWPESNSKAASFIPVHKPVGGAWQYEEML